MNKLKKTIKEIKKFFFIWYKYKEKVNEKELLKKPLKTLIILKDNENEYYSIFFPTFIAWLSIVISVFTSTYSQFNSWKFTNILGLYIFPVVSILFVYRLIKFFYIIDKTHKITDYNIKVYNKVIMDKLEKEEEQEKKYKDKKIVLLEEIRDNTRQKTK